jgi:cobalt-zinc-cadmium efflux system protein
MDGHSHSHVPPTAAGRHRWRLALILGLTLTVGLAEIIGAALSGSLALLSDAGHMATDAAGLGLALVATKLATRPTTPSRTFGLARLEVLAALVNGLTVLAVGVAVVTGGIGRLIRPVDVHPASMTAIAVAGLAVNITGLILLRRPAGESLNLRGAYLEVLGDLLGSVAVIVAGVVIAATGWVQADAVASIAIGLLIAPRAYSLLREVVHVLLEGTPRTVELAGVRRHLEAVEGVRAIHDLHAWTITSGAPALTAHVVVAPESLEPTAYHILLDALRDCLQGHFDVAHSTFQVEPEGHVDPTPSHP